MSPKINDEFIIQELRNAIKKEKDNLKNNQSMMQSKSNNNSINKSINKSIDKVKFEDQLNTSKSSTSRSRTSSPRTSISPLNKSIIKSA